MKQGKFYTFLAAFSLGSFFIFSGKLIVGLVFLGFAMLIPIS